MKNSEELKKLIEKELRFSSSRSSGPGGQNVNKVNTQVELRFSVIETFLFTEDEKSRLLEKLKNKINSAGELILTSQEGRSQLDNRELVTEKFFSTIESALRVRKRRIKTTPSPASVKQRIETKKNTALKKQLRKPPEV